MSWKCKIEVQTQALRVLVMSPSGDDLLKARLPDMPDHPRALLTMLEGLALWQGKPLSCVIFAANPVSHSLGLGAFGDRDVWPTESALVQVQFGEPKKRRQRIDGFGSFQQLRYLDGDAP